MSTRLSSSQGVSADDTLAVVKRLCLQTAARVNKVFMHLTACMQALVLPQISKHQKRQYLLFAAQLLTSDFCLVIIAKAMQINYQMENMLLLLSAGSVLPFFLAVRRLWVFIPCPALASLMTNTGLVFALVVLLMLGIGTYQGDYWMIYTYVMTVWPWLVLASAVARLWVERNLTKNPFSPVRELPVFGFMGALSTALTLDSAKHISVTEVIMLTCAMDPILSAGVASILLGPKRRAIHFRNIKLYALLIILVILFNGGETTGGMNFGAALNADQIWFMVARLLAVIRSIWVKRQLGSFHHTDMPTRPPESGLIFHSAEKPKKHRFKKFPAPTLLTLDCLFDSGLKDSELHSMGPLGTQDLHMLTDAKYLLPIATIMAWLNERDTISNGIIPTSLSTGNDAATAMGVVSNTAAGTSEEGVPLVQERITTFDVMVCAGFLLTFGISRLLVAWSTSRSIFDRGASIHSWKYQPVFMAIPFFFLDVLFLNGTLTKMQVIIVCSILGVLAYYRSELWNMFKRKYLLLCTQELHFWQPSALRQLQRRTLLEFLERLSTDDYAFMLMETAIRHGGNIRELARDTSVKVWDPAPSATAAWKLAFSLVTKSLRRQRLERDKRTNTKDEMHQEIEKMVIQMVYRAVESASGHGSRLRLAGNLQKVMAKRRAIRKLKELAENRRLLRRQRRTGQLAMAPVTLATSGGQIRSVREMAIQSEVGRIPALPAPPSPTSGRNVSMQLSLTQGGAGSNSGSGAGGENSPLLSQPGEVPSSDLLDLEAGPLSPTSTTGRLLDSGGAARGVYALTGLGAVGAPPVGAVVLAFGDARRGQLGLEPAAGAKQGADRCIIVVEELRGSDPVQVEASGVASYVVGARGQLWAFGSNRSMELGLRKEVSQVNQAQRVKSIRGCAAVQVAGSSSVSGQAHTYALTSAGEVYTFGTSSSGALGQGAQVTQTGPLIMRMSKQTRVKLVAAGAHHSLLVTDHGHLYSVGDNRHGQLGVGRRDLKNAPEPVPVEGDLHNKKVCIVACGDDHALATAEDGKLYAWGSCANGQLGLGRLDDQISPMAVRDLQDAGITSMACGSRHSLVLARNGTQLWAFGSNVSGQLGVGKGSNADGLTLSTPALVKALSNQLNLEVTQVVAASSHSLATTRAGEVFSFGDNTYGQLGFPPERSATPQVAVGGSASAAATMTRMEIDVPRTFMSGVARLWVPTRILGLALYKVWATSTADSHSLALAMG